MHFLGRIGGVAALAAVAVAAPTRLASRAVSSDVLGQLKLFAEYSAASYCTNNINSTGDALSCDIGNCASVQSAETTTLWEFDRVCSYGNVAGFFAVDKTNELLVLSFRGSRSVSTWIANINTGLTDVSSLCSGCEAHAGFWESWETVADDVASQLKSAQSTYPGYKVVVTGHSFGGAVAALASAALRNAGTSLELYTYGEPRLGNKALATYTTEQGSLWRVTHTNDIVPRLPPTSFGFSHPSPEYWVTSGNSGTPTTSDVTVVEGIDSKSGNRGELLPSVSAHLWYFGDMSGCE
ncbi:unnamed protein product [Penicillium olsonii]|uniref:Lipase n=1 Tax=Penicillium olsonii TaxID=99116 RepID=A0A9W4ICG0_PENOL|nr:unnamed protein product [Penicillium olsonii]CAG7927596.1 unnamed protein product [Penicillium olsonii]CAG8248022.1 unnamed protein product [Penicillium olsonii]CAG8260925.1 unnamed protein product [Penicillium olsonii]